MTSIDTVTLEVADPAAAAVFYKAAFDLGDRLQLSASEAPTSGYRGFTLALGVSAPATVDALIGAAIDAGATPIKPPKKSVWGYGGVVQAPDGTIWKVVVRRRRTAAQPPARSTRSCCCWGSRTSPRASGSTSSAGCPWEELRAEVRRVLTRRGSSSRSSGAARWPRTRAWPRMATGSHRIVIGSDAGSFTDPDGFAWEAAGTRDERLTAAVMPQAS